MHRTFTTLHCTYQNYAGNTAGIVSHTHRTAEPSLLLHQVLARYQQRIPKLRDEVLRRILEMA